jgi:hypothetical protein
VPAVSSQFIAQKYATFAWHARAWSLPRSFLFFSEWNLRRITVLVWRSPGFISSKYASYTQNPRRSLRWISRCYLSFYVQFISSLNIVRVRSFDSFSGAIVLDWMVILFKFRSQATGDDKGRIQQKDLGREGGEGHGFFDFVMPFINVGTGSINSFKTALYSSHQGLKNFCYRSSLNPLSFQWERMRTCCFFPSNLRQ